MDKKFNLSQWRALMLIANTDKMDIRKAAVPTKILRIAFSRHTLLDYSPPDCYMPFIEKAKEGDFGYGDKSLPIKFISETPTVTTANRIEAVILCLVTKTNYVNLVDKEKIIIGRYEICPKKFSLSMKLRLFNFITSSSSKRISRSWLLPLQEWILETQVRSKQKPKSTERRVGKPLVVKPRRTATTGLAGMLSAQVEQQSANDKYFTWATPSTPEIKRPGPMSSTATLATSTPDEDILNRILANPKANTAVDARMLRVQRAKEHYEHILHRVAAKHSKDKLESFCLRENRIGKLSIADIKDLYSLYEGTEPQQPNTPDY